MDVSICSDCALEKLSSDGGNISISHYGSISANK